MQSDKVNIKGGPERCAQVLGRGWRKCWTGPSAPHPNPVSWVGHKGRVRRVNPLSWPALITLWTTLKSETRRSWRERKRKKRMTTLCCCAHGQWGHMLITTWECIPLRSHPCGPWMVSLMIPGGHPGKAQPCAFPLCNKATTLLLGSILIYGNIEHCGVSMSKWPLNCYIAKALPVEISGNTNLKISIASK